MAAGFETGSTGAYRHMLEGPLGIQSRLQLCFGFFKIVADQQRPAAFAKIVHLASRIVPGAEGAFEMCCGRHEGKCQHSKHELFA